MRTSQALIAIGGKAQRIRREGIELPISKSFIRVGGKPLLYWSLVSLRAAGIEDLVLCGDHPLQLREAELLLDEINDKRFRRVTLFQDAGLGVHGLPYQVHRRAPDLLDNTFLFECGHSLMRPEHYQSLMSSKHDANIVFSLFESHPANRRQPIVLSRGKARRAHESSNSSLALAHPMVIDRSYAIRLPHLGFSITRILDSYAATGQLSFVRSEMPPEFDIVAEMDAALPLYETYIAATGLL